MLLKIRSAYRELNDLDLQRAPDGGGQTTYVNTRLPWERGEVVDEEPAGELEADAAG